MQQIRITRTADLNSVLSFLKECYPLLSEAEIVKMALSTQYSQEANRGRMREETLQDPTKRFTKEEWKKQFAVFQEIQDRIHPQDDEQLDEAIDRAVAEVRAKKRKTYERRTS